MNTKRFAEIRSVLKNIKIKTGRLAKGTLSERGNLFLTFYDVSETIDFEPFSCENVTESI